jgi:hypothetical protein
VGIIAVREKNTVMGPAEPEPKINYVCNGQQQFIRQKAGPWLEVRRRAQKTPELKI